MEDAAAQLARLAGASSSSSAPRVGVCVTGEARSFALRGVRASLQELLAQFEEPALRMILARRGSATCSGNVYSGSHKMCFMAQHSFFAMGEGELQAEFPTARITLVNVSNCATAPASATACCRATPWNATRQPGAFLQYFAVARCVGELLDGEAAAGRRPLTHVIRTRPDVVYLDPPAVARAVVGASRALLQRKGEDPLHHGRGPDIFMAAPAADARRFFSAVPERMAEHCTNGSVRMAHSTQPEGLFEGHRSANPFVLTSLPVVVINVVGQPSGCISQKNQSGCQELAGRIAHPPNAQPAAAADSAERIASRWAADRLGKASHDDQLHKHGWGDVVSLACGRGGVKVDHVHDPCLNGQAPAG